MISTAPSAEQIQRIGRNLEMIRQRIASAALRSGRDPNSVRLVGVSKSASLEETAALFQLGVIDLAENRVEQASGKIRALGAGPQWHCIGNLQRRKARQAVSLFQSIDAVDRLSLAETLQRQCEEQGCRVQVLLEVNVSGETKKHGFAPDELSGALVAMRSFDRLDVLGLLTMAPFDAPEPVLRGVFGGLSQLAQTHGLAELSMGMTDDFEIAIEEGATQVRIGRALFD